MGEGEPLVIAGEFRGDMLRKNRRTLTQPENGTRTIL